MSSQTQRGALFGALRNLADEISSEKTASHRKGAESPTPSDPGGYMGATTHPTKDTENRGQSASEGSRSSENTSDVNADQGAPGVNQAKDATPGQQDSVQLNIGTTQSATGEDPSVEDDYKGGKDDPGTDHPAATDNNSLDGHKYASASIRQLRDIHSNLSNAILADIATGQGRQLTKAALAKAAGESATLSPSAAGENTPAKPRQQAAGEAPSGKAPEAPNEKVAGTGLNSLLEKAANALSGSDDFAAGYELAEQLGIEKKAAEAAVAECLESTLNDAHTDADLFGSYYSGYMKKLAAEEPSPDAGEDHSGEGDSSSGTSDAGGVSGESETGGGEGGGGGGEDLGAMLGGGDAGGGMPGGDMGGGMPGGDAGGGMGQPSEEEVLTQLISALAELGISPEQLMQAAGGMGGGGGDMGGGMGGDMGGGMGGDMGGGMPPADPLAGGGAMPPMEGGAPAPPDAMGGMAPGGPDMGGEAPGMKIARAVKAFQRTGKYRYKAANDNTPQRRLREQMKSHILEIVRS
jgi:hypothetical protein